MNGLVKEKSILIFWSNGELFYFFNKFKRILKIWKIWFIYLSHEKYGEVFKFQFLDEMYIVTTNREAIRVNKKLFIAHLVEYLWNEIF